MYLIFDTETTGRALDFKASFHDTDNWPRMVQLAWQLHDEWGNLVENGNFLIKPEGFNIPHGAQKIHGISTELALAKGEKLETVVETFEKALEKADVIAGHNLEFDIKVVGAELVRLGRDTTLLESKLVADTMTEKTAELCKLEGGRGGRYKYPKLGELYEFLFGEKFDHAHNASADVEANARAFFELIRRGEFTDEELGREPGYVRTFQEKYPDVFPPFGLKHEDLFELSKALESGGPEAEETTSAQTVVHTDFVHLHVYSQYTVLSSTVKIPELVKKAAEEKMPAVALTDKNSLMGAFKFWREVEKQNQIIREKNKQIQKEIEEGNADENDLLPEIKPVIGMEINVARDISKKEMSDKGRSIVLLAKNYTGYKNLVKLSSIANTEGYYYQPRIDKKLLRQYKEGLICLTGGMESEIPYHILNIGENQAEEILKEYMDIFGGDLYLEMMRHGKEEEEVVNTTLKKWSEKYQIKTVATNQVHFLNQDDFDSYKLLVAVRDGGSRRGFGRHEEINDSYYFKSQAEMRGLFENDYPEALANIKEILDKIETYTLSRDIIMPLFNIPDEFKVEDDPDGTKSQAAYLRHLVFEGAKKRWGEPLPGRVKERLEFELKVIEEKGFPGYFLIVWDVIHQAKKMGVLVGPGRGSAAGSAVSYAIGITNVDPIKYNLLFERFLNPGRKSMPDIDMDFDDKGRADVVKYVVDKYGYDNVAQIITYGTMKAKSAIRDAFRVFDLPLDLADTLSKLADIPLDYILHLPPEEIKQLDYKKEHIDNALKFQQIIRANPEVIPALEKAAKVEGSLRNTGIHACGHIISPVKINEIMPVIRPNNSEYLVTQFDNDMVEPAGLLKMDFLGIKTLTIIKDAIRMVKMRHGVEIDLDNLSLDDKKTYELLQKGLTIGVFQFESPGMRKYLKQLKPNTFEDLVAMVALYRPGPMEYIPKFIRRKEGKEPVEYDLPEMEEVLKSTYGITVYQEQVMILARKLAGFTPSEADDLRKAMGKKKKDLLDAYKDKFIQGGLKNGHPQEKLEKIWKDWEAFAQYAFNRSHAVSYALVAYYTAYLKANFPPEFFAASLTAHFTNRDKVTTFLEDTHHFGIKILSPDVNESGMDFMVNKEGNIRFGLAGIKGVGSSAAEEIIKEREKHGPFKNIFDFIERINVSKVSIAALEKLALSGAFDTFGIDRGTYFCSEGNGEIWLKKLQRYGQRRQEEKNSNLLSLFGGDSGVELPKPVIPKCESFSHLEMLEKEKELLGYYVSGHPLDQYKKTLETFAQYDLDYIQSAITSLNENRDILLDEHNNGQDEEIIVDDEGNVEVMEKVDEQVKITLRKAKTLIGKRIRLGGIITDARHKTTQRGEGYAFFQLEDYKANLDLGIFGEEYDKSKHLIENQKMLGVEAVINENWRKPGEYRITAKRLFPLYNLLEKQSKELKLTIPEHMITKDFVDNLLHLFTAHKGKVPLYIKITSPADKIHIDYQSKAIKVQVTEELLKTLDEMGVDYALKMH